MTLSELQTSLDHLDISLSICGDGLVYDAPPDALTDEIMAALKERKAELITMFSEASAQAAPRPRPIPDKRLAVMARGDELRARGLALARRKVGLDMAKSPPGFYGFCCALAMGG